MLEARARDAHGNETPASLTVTVVPASAARPYISISEPRGQSYNEGALITMRARVISEAAIAHVRLALGASEVTLTQPPWQHTFRAPQLQAPPGIVVARASAVDVLGRRECPGRGGGDDPG